MNGDVRLRTCEDVDHGSVILKGRFLPTNGDVFGELVRFDPNTNIPLLVQYSASTAELEIRDEVVGPAHPAGLSGLAAA